jgi:hypothetical protein
MQPISLQRVHHTPTFLLIYLLSSSLSSAAKGLPNTTGLTNSSLDPKDDPNNPLGYIASNTLTGVAFSVYNQIILFYTQVYRTLERSCARRRHHADFESVEMGRMVDDVHEHRRVQYDSNHTAIASFIKFDIVCSSFRYWHCLSVRSPC